MIVLKGEEACRFPVWKIEGKTNTPDTRKPALGGLLVGSISSCDEPEPVFGGTQTFELDI
jgi:hypothetical protein